MSLGEDEIRSRWPLHWLVWKDDHKALKRLLESPDAPKDLEQMDPRGRTALHLAVSLNRLDCTHHLLFHNASPLTENRHKWSVSHEAICTGNPELIGVVLRIRDKWQEHIRTREVPLMLERLQNAPDFYMEMKWELSSWLPFVTRMCPSDTCRIWKKGTAVRIDSTLVGYEKLGWKRGHQTIIFQATSTGHSVCDINHGEKTVWQKEFNITTPDPVQKMFHLEMDVLRKMKNPVVSTFINTDNIVFERQKSGIWGFRSDKTEEVDGYQAKVFGSTGLEIVTNIRVEHLPESEKHKHRSINPLHEFFGADEEHADNMPLEAPPTKAEPVTLPPNRPHLTMSEYFTEPTSKKDYDAICRPPEVFTRTQKLKASVSLAESYPLSLQDQIMPILDLMALNTPHFAKVKDFISLQMPSGFPVKFEIPLFHVISVKVSFHNINGHKTPAPHVSLSSSRKKAEPVAVLTPPSTPTEVGGIKRRHGQAGSGKTAGSPVDVPRQNDTREAFNNDCPGEELEVCTISDECFTIPSGYRQLHGGGRGTVDQEEQLLQMAIQQSLAEQQPGGGPDTPTSSTGQHQSSAEQQPIKRKEALTLQEALLDEELIRTYPNSQIAHSGQAPPTNSGRGQQSAEDEELELALALSRELALEEERQRMAADDDEFERILKMSLQDK